MAGPDDLLKPDEVAPLLRVEVTNLERMRRERRGPPWIKISGELGKSGGRIRYRRSDVEQYIQSRRVVPSADGPQPYDIPLPGLDSEQIGGIISERLPLDPT